MSKENVIQSLRKLTPKFCDNCGHQYVPEDFKVIKVVENNALVHLTCANCANTYIINAFTNQTSMGSQRIPLVLDIEGPSEVEKFAKNEPTSKDDAVDLYNFLTDNKNLGDLFSSLKVNRAVAPSPKNMRSI